MGKSTAEAGRHEAERAEHSVIQEFTEENYPYMNHIFCAKCGWPLKHGCTVMGIGFLGIAPDRREGQKNSVQAFTFWIMIYRR